ncbi:hypothetical protein RHMOL_Rhmol01G0310900 [Rhododendron molle]|uniref:Uncharacterized protein n=1 Tax=Rhododendron molle TaxID=49168 RepID=A0ACC0Q7B3_RHOML|nr:hypothetical protein RHMOL_Rhmol01G0310900 [Rhododendron molle]
MGRVSDSPPVEGEDKLQIKVHPRSGDTTPNDKHHHRLSTTSPPRPPPQMYQPFKKHFSWLVPVFVVINVALFIIVMYLNDCPKRSNNCVGADVLGRFAFQSLKENPLLGPSGPTLQSMGALEVKKVVEQHELAALLTLVLIIAINLAVGILPHVDNFAHLGGFGTGFLLGFVFLIRPQYAWVRQRNSPPGYYGNSSKPKYKIYQRVLLVISLIILVAGFVSGLVLLLRGVDGNDHCPWCHYLSCVPTPLWKCKPEQVYCESSTIHNQLDLKCLSNGKSKVYTFDATNSTTSLEQLCSQLCS